MGTLAACREILSLPWNNVTLIAGRKICDSGDTTACVATARAFESASQLTEARELYLLSCDDFKVEGCVATIDFAKRVRDGQSGHPPDPTAALSMFSWVCYSTSPVGCAGLAATAKILHASEGTSDRVTDAYITACARGNEGCPELTAAIAGSVPAKAREITEKACMDKFTFGFFAIGEITDVNPSQFDDVNPRENVPGMCGSLGKMYQNGIGGEQDQKMALRLYRFECARSRLDCDSQYNLEGVLNTEVWNIRPDPKKEVVQYQNIRFRSFDQVYVEAGGCVNTHGLGDTTKRYVDPRGPDSDRLYSGTILIPGRMQGGMTRIGGWLNQWLEVPELRHDQAASAFLSLGYQDDDRRDNDYLDFDEGTDGQCRGMGPAWVRITIRGHSTGNPSPAPSSAAPMDLVWQEIDDNLYPLNPSWTYQVSHRALPDAAALCNSFENSGDNLNLGGCTTQRPTTDEHSGPNLNPFSDTSLFWASCHFLENGPAMRDSSVHGHVNWGNVTYTGTLYFEDYQNPQTSVGSPFPVADDDYDLALVRAGQEGATDGNHFQYASVGPKGIDLEFNASEVIRSLDAPYWNTLRSTVDAHILEEIHGRAGDWTAPQALTDGREAIVVGLMGIDTKHSMHAEIHPVLGLAVKIDADPNRERWAFFARRSGNEGGCSQDLHDFDYDELAFFFPNRGRTNFAFDREHTLIRASGIPGRMKFRNWPDGVVVNVGVGPRGSVGVVYGELAFCNSNCAGGHFSPMVPLTRSLAQAADRFSVLGLNSIARRGPHPEAEEREEGRLDDVLALLSGNVREEMRVKLARPTPAPSGRKDLSQAIRALTALSTPIARPAPPPPPDVTIEEDTMPNVQRRARTLRRSETMALPPAQSSPDTAGATTRREAQTAIKNAIGDEQFRELIETVRRQNER
jgi:hypothetical protein